MATRKQKAAAKRNIKKALAALSKERKHGHKAKKHHTKRHHAKRHHAKRRHSKRGGKIPMHILERRLKKLAHIVHKRRGR